MPELDVALASRAAAGRGPQADGPTVRPAIWSPSAIAGDTRASIRLERVLALGRAFLTIVALLAIVFDPGQPERQAGLTYAVLASYAVYSLAALAYVYRTSQFGTRQGWILHGLDILWTIVVTAAGAGPVSPFFLFFVFLVLAAAYRWGLVGTVATAFVTVTVYVIDVAAYLANAGPTTPGAPLDAWLNVDGFELHRAIIQVAYLLLTGMLLGYLAEQDKRSRGELEAIARLTREPQVHRGVGGSVAAVSRALLRMFDAESICFVLQDFETHEAWLWRLDRGMAEATRNPPRVPLDADQQALWLFPDPGQVWYGTRRRGGSDLRVEAVRPGAPQPEADDTALPGPVSASGPFTSLVVANFGLPDEWRGRVYLFDPRERGDIDQSLYFIDALVEHVAPALTNVFLLARLRARVTAAERARVARELHDGAIQALLGIELKVEALRRQADHQPATVATELADVQQLLRQQVLELRELMQALRPLALDASEQLPDVLASVVERFRRDTGVPARFMFTGGAARLPPATALEVVRIAQEALVNVRKHSRARSVLVRLTGGENGYILAIEDDGIGFDFEGHVSGDELDRRRLGPAIIRERARAAGAHLSIDSTPGAGARIELIVNTAHG
jgi:signal transduction histidine kinase